MSLEEDIRQKAFRNEYHKALLNILYTENYLIGRMTEHFKKHDITRQQYNVLRILRGQYPQPASINVIKERMLEKMSDASRIVGRLRIKGLIRRQGGKNDKRAAAVTITEKGMKLLEAMQEHVDQMELFLNNLTPEEARALNNLLDKIRTPDLQNPEKLFQALELLNQPEKI